MPNDDMAIYFAEWIKKRRESLKMTRKGLAATTNSILPSIENIKATAANIKNIEGGISRPKELLARKLAKALQIPDIYCELFVQIAREEKPDYELEPIPSLTMPQFSEQSYPRAVVFEKGKESRLKEKSAGKLFGREGYVLEIQSLLDENKSVLLHGFTGIGKTVLAAEVAISWIDKEKGSVLWLDNLKNERGLFATLSQALAGQSSLEDEYLDWDEIFKFAKQRNVNLFIVDDIQSGIILNRFLKGKPKELLVLTTSQIRIPVNEMEIVEVTDLSQEMALDLLNYHLRAGYLNDGAEKELCKKLGYHPFAIAIAGSLMREGQIPPKEYLRLHGNKLTDAKDPLNEQKSILNLIENSLKILIGNNGGNNKYKQVMNIFASLFSQSATSALLSLYMNNTDNSVEKTLIDLEKHALLKRTKITKNQGGHYSFHDLMYSYIKENKSHIPNKSKALEACFKYIQQYKDDINAIHDERENILEATRFAFKKNPELFVNMVYPLSVSGQYFDAFGNTSEILGFLKDAAQIAINNQWLSEADLLLGKVGNIFRDRLGNVEEALKFYQHALELAQHLGNKSREAILTSSIAITHFLLKVKREDLETKKLFVEGNFALAQDIANECNDAYTFCVLYQHKSFYHQKKNPFDYELAHEYAEKAITLAHKFELHEYKVKSLINKGGCELELSRIPLINQQVKLGWLSQAIQTHHKALDFAELHNNYDWIGSACHSLGEDYDEIGDRVKAQFYFDKAQLAFYEIEAQARLLNVQSVMYEKGYEVKSLFVLQGQK